MKAHNFGSRDLASAMAIALGVAATACSGTAPEYNAPRRPNVSGILPGDPVDLDGNGRYDGVAIDCDGDGKADGVDTDADGVADQPLPGGSEYFCGRQPPPVEVCPEDNPYCGGDNDGEVPAGCGVEKFDLNPVGVNVMVAMDGSYSMNAVWTPTQEAIRDMILANPKQNYGMHMFWGEPVENIIEGIVNVNFCGHNQNEVLEPAPNQQKQILPFMGTQAPGQGNAFFDFTPVVDPLNYYLENTTTLEDPKSTNYLVFVSDGNENCFGTAFASRADKLLAYEKLGTELVKKNIRLLPIGFSNTGQVRPGGSMRTTNFEALNTLAKFGGSGLTEAILADNAAALKKALQTVAQRVRPCRFQVPATLDPTKNLNPFELNFVLGSKLVQRDRERVEGWNFVDGNTSEVEFFGDACEAIQFGAPLEARKGCESEVCGTSATQVSTKPRAVQYLLDRSLTMNDCSNDAPFGCVPASVGGGGGLTWWGVMAKSIGMSVVATVNDDVEFGLRMFPSAGSNLSCDVHDDPEVTPSSSSELTIIRSLLSNLPLGLTPLVAALEKTADLPGRLSEDLVTGAVIVVSDGGDSGSCGVEQQEAVLRAGEAAKRLLDVGIKTYVIRFGSIDGTTTNDDEILHAIVDNGGTALVDPAQPEAPRYYSAPNEAELNEVLNGISQALADCAFTLGELQDPNVDKSKVNLYLNGEVVPMDENEGWSFSDEAQTEIRMHGDACTQFKNNRTTSLVVEFGCEPIVLF